MAKEDQDKGGRNDAAEGGASAKDTARDSAKEAAKDTARDSAEGAAKDTAKAEGPFTHDAFPGMTFDNPVEEQEIADGTTVYRFDPRDLFLAVRSVRDQGFRVLSCLSAYDDKKNLGVFYAFLRLAEEPDQFGEIRLRTLMPQQDEEGNPLETVCPSITDIYPGADWQEREMYDMYGIRFKGHPDLRRMFLPEDWDGYPMRKDYDQPEQFVAMQDGEDITVKEQQEGSW